MQGDQDRWVVSPLYNLSNIDYTKEKVITNNELITALEDVNTKVEEYNQIEQAYMIEVNRAESLLEENIILKQEIEKLNGQLREIRKDKECLKQDKLSIEDTVNFTC